MIITAIIVFFCGAIYEACCVGWLHYSERNRPFLAALFAMLCAGSQLTGFVDSIKDIRLAPVFIFGYGFGTFIAVFIKSNKKS